MTDLVHRTILLLDIENFSGRDDVEQKFLRRSLVGVVEDTFAAADVEGAQQYREDRGDGLVILLSADVPKARLLNTLIHSTPGILRSYNRVAARSTQMRLRIVLATGEVGHDSLRGTVGGLVGHDLNQACRLLDTGVLKAALKERADDLALCVSAAVYEGVVRHGHLGVHPEEFRHVRDQVKNDVLDAWLLGPIPRKWVSPLDGDSAVPGGAGQAGAETVRRVNSTIGSAPVGNGPITFGGGLAGGNQTGVSGGNVTGDVVFGTKVERHGHGRHQLPVDFDDKQKGKGQW